MKKKVDVDYKTKPMAYDTLLDAVLLNGLIVVHERTAKVIKKWSDVCWRLKFTDNGEIINVFYPLSEDWHCA